MFLSLVPRVVLVALGVLAIAWLGLSIHNARLTDRVREVAENPNPAATDVRQALRDLDRADRLNPDRAEGLAYEAVLRVRTNDLRGAVTTLEELARREPENPEAWLLLSALTRESDPARSAEAKARLDALDPRGAEQRRRREGRNQSP